MRVPERAVPIHRKRVLVYSHDTYGLGHLRRCLVITARLAGLVDPPAVLIATGSPRAQAFDLPDGCDTVKLPSVTKRPGGAYRPRSLEMPFGDLVALRSDVLRAAGRAFRPDVVLVDHAPLGMEGELRPLLADLARADERPYLVLGLRDIIDDAGRVREEWDRIGAWAALQSLYDGILVYGDPLVTTTAVEIGLADRFPGGVTHVGYVGRSLPKPRRTGDPFILVTTGGGGDGHDLLRRYAQYLGNRPGPTPFRSVVVTGPFLSARRRREIEAAYAGTGQPVELVTFTDRFEQLLVDASGVVAMAGYNTVVEILCAGVPALLVPRQTPRREQRIRAERLSSVAAVEFVPADRCGPETIEAFVWRALAESHRSAAPVRLDGASRTAEVLARLLESPRTNLGHDREREALVAHFA
jgi:predicted glycosyltransferase